MKSPQFLICNKWCF